MPVRKKTHRRKVTISVCLPATVELIVESDDDAPDEESDWTITSVTRTTCEASPRTVNEQMHDSDFEALAVAAANAEDLR